MDRDPATDFVLRSSAPGTLIRDVANIGEELVRSWYGVEWSSRMSVGVVTKPGMNLNMNGCVAMRIETF